jgi:hypothetical protein
MQGWNEFFIAAGGAAGALTGLMFVGVSVNLAKILSIANLPNRALLSLILLLNILIVSILMLVPGQSLHAVGIEVLIIGGIVWAATFIIDTNILHKKEKRYKGLYLFNILINQISVVPYIVAGIVLLKADAQGFYWMVPAIVFSFIKAVLDAWVLLIEINR